MLMLTGCWFVESFERGNNCKNFWYCTIYAVFWCFQTESYARLLNNYTAWDMYYERK
jgi:hypothetical protein